MYSCMFIVYLRSIINTIIVNLSTQTAQKRHTFCYLFPPPPIFESLRYPNGLQNLFDSLQNLSLRRIKSKRSSVGRRRNLRTITLREFWRKNPMVIVVFLEKFSGFNLVGLFIFSPLNVWISYPMTHGIIDLRSAVERLNYTIRRIVIYFFSQHKTWVMYVIQHTSKVITSSVTNVVGEKRNTSEAKNNITHRWLKYFFVERTFYIRRIFGMKMYWSIIYARCTCRSKIKKSYSCKQLQE